MCHLIDSVRNETMAINPANVLRLNMPQWQGGDRPEYWIGGRVLAAIAPEPQGPEETVPVPHGETNERPVESGIISRTALIDQCRYRAPALERC